VTGTRYPKAPGPLPPGVPDGRAGPGPARPSHDSRAAARRAPAGRVVPETPNARIRGGWPLAGIVRPGPHARSGADLGLRGPVGHLRCPRNASLVRHEQHRVAGA